MDEECLWQWSLTVPTAMTCALVEATLDHIMITRPTPTEEEPQHMCPDAGYDYDAVYETLRTHQYEPHIRPNLHKWAHAKPTSEPEEESSSSLESTKQPRRSRGGALALMTESLSTLVGALGEAGFDL